MFINHVFSTLSMHKFASGATHQSKVSTRSKSRTLFPLFDETFDMIIPANLNPENLFLLFSVKDRGPFGDSLLLGESLVPLHEVARCDQDCSLQDLAQIQLPLTRPGPNIVDILTAIETRK